MGDDDARRLLATPSETRDGVWVDCSGFGEGDYV
jgi:hypothetical protein